MITLSKDVKISDPNHKCLYQVVRCEEDAEVLRKDGWKVWNKPVINDNGPFWKAIKEIK